MSKSTDNNFDPNKELKCGFTTGSAATAAASAALTMLITGNEISHIEIETPAKVKYMPIVYGQEIYIKNKYEKSAKCYVIKESGDDPDVTKGIKIFAKVSLKKEEGVTISGGEGIGVVTRPGLDQKVGEWAINSTPRKMIIDSVNKILDDYDLESGVHVEISAPQGVEIAAKTFNPHMGIEGGISIIGTTGIVEPMSTKALIDTIKLDISMQHSEGKEKCIIVPGNYGVTFLKDRYGINEDDIVLCSNYVGESIKLATEAGFKKILFCSHIGKMIKVSGGIENTHSMYGDHRMEFMCDAYKEACRISSDEYVEVKKDIIDEIMNCVSTTAALDVLNSINMVESVSKVIVEKSVSHIKEWCENKAEIECILYENSYGELARSF